MVAQLNLARLGVYKCSLGKTLNSAQVQILKGDRYTKGLRASVRAMWKALGRHHGFTATSAAQRWTFYRGVEREVMDVVVSQCSGRVFREHDGLRTDTAVDVGAVQAVVKARTGYEIVLSSKYTEKVSARSFQ